jgi:hypothetical protein
MPSPLLIKRICMHTFLRVLSGEQKAYTELIALARLNTDVTAGGDTQGYSSDFDWKVSHVSNLRVPRAWYIKVLHT